MVRILSGLAVALLLAMPQIASAQALPGIGIGGMGQQSQLGPPPAGVLLHQTYMQLYGLPVNFQQQQQFNNNQAGGGYGGYGGGGYGGYPRYFGVNYQRQQQLAYMQAAAAYYNASAAYYNQQQRASATPPANFGTGYATPVQPTFGSTSSPSMTTSSNGFSGFGLNTANPFVATKKDEVKKEEKK